MTNIWKISRTTLISIARTLLLRADEGGRWRRSGRGARLVQLQRILYRILWLPYYRMLTVPFQFTAQTSASGGNGPAHTPSRAS